MQLPLLRLSISEQAGSGHLPRCSQQRSHATGYTCVHAHAPTQSTIVTKVRVARKRCRAETMRGTPRHDHIHHIQRIPASKTGHPDLQLVTGVEALNHTPQGSCFGGTCNGTSSAPHTSLCSSRHKLDQQICSPGSDMQLVTAESVQAMLAMCGAPSPPLLTKAL